MKQTTTYVGIDAHKKDLFVAMLIGTQSNPVSWTVPNEPQAVRRLVKKLEREAPGAVQVSSIVTLASGRPYNILAGADLNGDGDGGTSSPDRARRDPASEPSSIGRNTGVMPYQAIVDVRVSRRFRVSGRLSVEGLFEVFNLFNRTNFVEINNIFGTGAYPGNPLPTFGQFIQAAAPLQVQLAAKIHF